MANKVYKIPDVMDILKIGKTAAYKLIRSGELESFRIGRSIRVTEEALNSYIADHSVKKNE